ncbi:MAG: carboxypeptidase regulatory-like domain-containing protein [Actinomycetota bacterium]|nr:carboxypeptidase regulatory-like domain-containing protein [Actinomycetota bacterium]
MNKLRPRARRSTSLAAVVFLVLGLLGAATTAAQAADTAHITGKVTKAGGAGVAGITVAVFKEYNDEGDVYWDELKSVNTGTTGTYNLSALPAGSYRLGFYDENGLYETEYFDNATSVETAKTIPLAAGATSAGKNAELSLAAHIKGKVTKPGGVGIAGVDVIAYQEIDEDGDTYIAPVNYTSTDAGGNYDLGGLTAGTYRVGFEDFENNQYQSEYFDNVADVEDAEDIVVASAATAAGKNAELAPGAHIKGKVTRPGGVGLADIDVSIYQEFTDDGDTYWDTVNGTFTNPDGTYDVGTLPPGTYRVGFEDYDSGKYLPEYFDNAATVEDAEDITVADAATAAGKNAELALGGRITGKVTKPGGAAIANVNVIAYQQVSEAGDTYWQEFQGTSTGTNGTYDLGGLPTGTYRIGFRDGNETIVYAGEYWNNKASIGAAADIAVTQGSATTGKNAELAVGGHIKGKVTKPGGAALANIGVDALQQSGPGGDWEYVAYTQSKVDGTYDVSGLAAGTYRLEFTDYVNEVYATEFFDNKSNISSATDVPVTTGGTVTGKNAILELGSSISGTVSFPNGSADYGFDGIVTVVDIPSGDFAGFAETTPDEPDYTVSGLAAGSYRVEFGRIGGPSVAAAQFYDGVDESAGPAAATPVALAIGQDRTGINASLEEGGTIAGTVVDPMGDPVAGCSVEAYTADGNLAAREGVTGGDGSFGITGLSTGSYKLVVNPDKECAGVPRYYTGADGVLSGTESEGSTIAATLGETTNLDNDLVYKSAADVIDNTASPTVTGTPKVGETLTAEDGDWTPSGVAFGYQWLADGAVISGATAKTYVPVAAVVDKKLSVKVTGSKSGLVSVSETSAETAVVAKGELTNPTAPTVTGTAQVGKTLTAQDGSWTPSGVAYGYQWLVDGIVISGATAKTYVPTASVVGKKLSVKVTGSKAGYTSLSTTSAETAVVAQPDVANTVAPTVSGTAQVGKTLTANNGTWSPTGVTFTYEWSADGTPIAGAGAKTYVLVAGDLGKKLSVTVTGAKAGHNSLSKTSAQTAAIAPADVTPPGPLTTPKHLRSTGQGASTMTLAWDAVAGAERYRIQISKSSSMSNPKYVSFDTNTGTVTGLASNTKFYFRVSVVNAADTARLTAYTPKTYPSAKTKAYDLSAPGHLRSTAQSSTTLTLAWDVVATAPRYRIQYSTSSNMASPKYVSFAGNSGDLTGLKPNTKYYFRVAVANADDSARLSQYSVSPGPSATTKVATTP